MRDVRKRLGQIDLRSFKVASIDQDGTIYRRDPLSIVARDLGRYEEVDRLERLRRAGKISTGRSLRGQFGILEGMTSRKLGNYMRKVKPIQGLRPFLKFLRGSCLRVVLLTDNPACIANYAVRFGFQDIVCSQSELSEARVIGRTIPLVNKATALASYCKTRGIHLKECLHVGNGDNDLPVFRRVGASIAINPESEEVRDAADFNLESDSILELKRFFSLSRPD